MTAVRATLDSRAGVVGEYRTLTKLASGGMATVYVGSKLGMEGFNRLVAIKCCHDHLTENAEFVSMFLDEARLAASIRHPNVVATLDVGRRDKLYLVMEYVEGTTLHGLLKRAAEKGQRLPVAVTLAVMDDTLAGLHAAHELQGPDGRLVGLVHRDVSPHNVLVGVDGISKITDFGIAFAEARSILTQEGHVKGKFSYMAPESLLSGQPISRRMDVFSAGVVLWESLAGRMLFKKGTDIETLNAVVIEEAPKPSKYNPEVSAELDEVVLKALTKDPTKRYQTAAEFRQALSALSCDRAESNDVGAIVSTLFGPELAERREKIRNEPGTPIDFTPPFALPTTKPPGSAPPPPPRSLPPGEIEHRRMRGLIAAIMLILVGSALGLILSRNSPDTKPQPTQNR